MKYFVFALMAFNLLAEESVKPPEPPEESVKSPEQRQAEKARAELPKGEIIRLKKTPKTVVTKKVPVEIPVYHSFWQFKLGAHISLTPPEPQKPWNCFKVFQVISDNELLIEFEEASWDGRGGSSHSKDMFIFREAGISKGRVTGAVIKMEDAYKIVETKTYETRTGSNTVWVIEKLFTDQ